MYSTCSVPVFQGWKDNPVSNVSRGSELLVKPEMIGEQRRRLCFETGEIPLTVASVVYSEKVSQEVGHMVAAATVTSTQT